MTKRDYCINELVETEKNYIEALAMIINVCSCFSAEITHNMIQYNTRCCFNVLSKADMSQIDRPHGTNS